MAARWSSENVVVEFRDAQVSIDYALLKPTSVSTLLLFKLSTLSALPVISGRMDSKIVLT